MFQTLLIISDGPITTHHYHPLPKTFLCQRRESRHCISKSTFACVEFGDDRHLHKILKAEAHCSHVVAAEAWVAVRVTAASSWKLHALLKSLTTDTFFPLFFRGAFFSSRFPELLQTLLLQPFQWMHTSLYFRPTNIVFSVSLTKSCLRPVFILELGTNLKDGIPGLVCRSDSI